MFLTIQDLKSKDPVSQWPTLRGLRAQTLTREEFVAGQRDFFHAVCFFGRPLMLLAARLPTYGARWTILENVLEEHGRGDSDQTHGASFSRFLHAMGATPTTKPSATIDAFNTALWDIANHSNPLEAIATFGMIEDRFATISTIIGNGVVERGWVKQEQLHHYVLHEELDHVHAAALYKIIESNWTSSEGNHAIRQGFETGNRLLKSVYAAS